MKNLRTMLAQIPATDNQENNKEKSIGRMPFHKTKKEEDNSHFS